MDAAQIMMMPTAAGSTQVSVLPAATTNNALAGLFVNMLGQNILGLDGLCGLQQNTLQSQPEPVLAPSTDSMVALTHERADQDLPSTESDPAFVNQLAAYAQLAVLQTSLPVQQLQQTVISSPIETAAQPVLGLEATQAVTLPDNVGVVGDLAVTAETTPAELVGVGVQNTADSKENPAGIQKEVPKEMIGHSEALATAKVTPLPPASTSSSKPPRAAADVPVLQEMSLQVEPEKQLQSNQISSQKAVQQAGETQPAAQDVSGAVKVAPTAVQQPVRFAQHSDVVIAAAETEGQGNATADQQYQGSQMTAKAPKELVMQGGQVKPELLENAGTTFRLPEQHAVPMPTGQPVVVATDGATTELVKNVPQELVGRQVIDRLVNHEIKQGSDQISLKLSPENLGSLQLNMRMEDNRLKLEIVAESRGVRDALLQQADDLKETLARQNIKVDSFNVTTGNGNQSHQQSADWRQMTQEQRQYQPQYASLRAKTGTADANEAPMKYFVPQYQSTLDVRF